MKRIALPIFALLLVLMALVVPAALAQSVTVTLNADTVNVRSGPGLQYTIRGGFKSGSLTVNGRTSFEAGRQCSAEFAEDLDMWLRVDFRGLEGWVARCAVNVEGNLDALPTAAASAPLLVADLYADDEATPSVEDDFGPAPSGTYLTGFTLSRVNFREAGSLTAKIKQTLAGGQGLYIVGRSADDRWIQVSFQGETGWVARYLMLLPSDFQKTIPVK